MNDPANPSSVPDPASATPPAVELDADALARIQTALWRQQNLALGLVGGLAGSAIGAAIWAAIAVSSEQEFAILAIGIGFITGFAVRRLGKGITPVYGVVGAVFSLLGILVGKVATLVWYVAEQYDLGIGEVLSQMEFADLEGFFTETFSPVDVLFYGLALYCGYKYAFRQVTEAEVQQLRAQP